MAGGGDNLPNNSGYWGGGTPLANPQTAADNKGAEGPNPAQWGGGMPLKQQQPATLAGDNKGSGPPTWSGQAAPPTTSMVRNYVGGTLPARSRLTGPQEPQTLDPAVRYPPQVRTLDPMAYPRPIRYPRLPAIKGLQF
jgi:hypothetical protein